MTSTLTGHAAIEYAEANGLTLSSYSDPTEDGRAGLTPDEAREIASEDPELVYLTPVTRSGLGGTRRGQPTTEDTMTSSTP